MISSEDIIVTARSWLGTKFHHQGRKKNAGVDCIGLIVGVASELGFKVNDKTDYAREPKNNELESVLEKYLAKSDLAPGRIALFKIAREPQHVGIISDYPGGSFGLIHAYSQIGKVVEHNLDKAWQRRLVATYSFPE